jgi:hypothetical protein
MRHVGLVVKLIVEVAIKWTMDNGNGEISRKLKMKMATLEANARKKNY